MSKKRRRYGGGRIFRPMAKWTRKDGSIEERESKWLYVEWYQNGRKKRQRVVGADGGPGTREEAEALLKECVAVKELAVARGEGSLTNHVRLLPVCEEFLDHIRKTKTARTHTVYTYRIDSVLSRVDCEYVDELNKAILEAYLAERVGEGMAARTANNHVGTFKQALRWGVEMGRIKSDPTGKVKRRTVSPTRFRRALDDEEVRRLVQSSPEAYGRIWRFFVGTGLRFGELAGLIWSDIDLGRAMLRVRSENVKVHKGRDIPLSPGLVEMLERHKGEAEREAKTAADTLAKLSPAEKQTRCLNLHTRGDVLERFAEREHVFVTQAGRPWNENMLRRKLGSCVRAAGIDEKGVDLHALRYTFGSHLIRRGVNIKVVQELMGHADVRMTLQIYAQAFNPDKRSAVAHFDEIMAEKALEAPELAEDGQKIA